MSTLAPIVAGCVTALSWGSADFIARFTGRALGVVPALFAMLASSALIVSAIAWRADRLPDLMIAPASSMALALGLLVAYGTGAAAATLALYRALALGPVTVAAPIAGSFPAFNLLVAFVLGTRPSPLEWLAMVSVMAGVAIVARSAQHFEAERAYSATELRHTVLMAVAASALFGLSVSAGQEAGAIFGDLEAVCAGRWIGVLACALLLLGRRNALTIPMRWWPIVTAQGALDATAYITLLLGSAGAESPVAPVIGSTFSVVTVALARIALGERMTAPQWLGIALVVAGVVLLSGL